MYMKFLQPTLSEMHSNQLFHGLGKLRFNMAYLIACHMVSTRFVASALPWTRAILACNSIMDEPGPTQYTHAPCNYMPRSMYTRRMHVCHACAHKPPMAYHHAPWSWSALRKEKNESSLEINKLSNILLLPMPCRNLSSMPVTSH